MATKPTISFVIGSYNRRQFIRATLDNVRREAKPYAHEIIVVDGGSSDGTVEYLLAQKDIITIVQHNRGTWNGRPLPRRSWGYFINLAFKCAQGRLVCMLSDDCLLVPGSIGAALELYEVECRSKPLVGGIAFYFRDWPDEIQYKVHRTYGRNLAINHGIYVREALEAVDYADEDNYGFYCADGDLSLRIWEAGYRIVACPQAFVEHHAHAPERASHSRKEQYEQDMRFSRERWKHLIGIDEFVSDWPSISYTDPANTIASFPVSGMIAQARWKFVRRSKDVLRSVLRRTPPCAPDAMGAGRGEKEGA